jgi:hypothetical protein
MTLAGESDLRQFFDYVPIRDLDGFTPGSQLRYQLWQVFLFIKYSD